MRWGNNDSPLYPANIWSESVAVCLPQAVDQYVFFTSQWAYRIEREELHGLLTSKETKQLAEQSAVQLRENQKVESGLFMDMMDSIDNDAYQQMGDGFAALEEILCNPANMVDSDTHGIDQAMLVRTFLTPDQAPQEQRDREQSLFLDVLNDIKTASQ